MHPQQCRFQCSKCIQKKQQRAGAVVGALVEAVVHATEGAGCFCFRAGCTRKGAGLASVRQITLLLATR